jgi:hypothetical protein
MCRGTRMHGVGDEVDDKRRDKPREVLRHLNARRG